MATVQIWTDGSCLVHRSGAGGWAAILRCKGVEKVLRGGAKNTTNNQMEITAALQGLRALKKPCQVEIFSDSQYVIMGATDWAISARNRGWRGSTGKPFKNHLLWQELLIAAEPHVIDWCWVEGHAECANNNRADEIARNEAEKYIVNRR
jgi:ribonuclease HI